MSDMRDRIIKLHEKAFKEWCNCNNTHISYAEYICDYLIANGVIVLPCAKGATVYEVVNYSNHLKKGNVVGFHWGEFPDLRGHKRKNYLIAKFYGCLVHLPFDRIGKTVFFTREESEKVLKEREKK